MFELVKQMLNKNALVDCIPGGQQLSRKRATSHMSLTLASPIQHVDCSSFVSESFSLTATTAEEQSNSKTVSIFGFSFEGGIEHNSQMSVFTRHLRIMKPLGVLLNP